MLKKFGTKVNEWSISLSAHIANKIRRIRGENSKTQVQEIAS